MLCINFFLVFYTSLIFIKKILKKTLISFFNKYLLRFNFDVNFKFMLRTLSFLNRVLKLILQKIVCYLINQLKYKINKTE